MLTFPTKMKDIQSQVQTFDKAIQELRNSKQFSSILELVLAIGNFFNSGSQRGQAYGFKLDSLLRLAETKTTDNKKSLLHYFAHLMETKFSQYLNFRDEIPTIPAASKRKFIVESFTYLSSKFASAST
jgi:diaphanous protein